MLVLLGYSYTTPCGISFSATCMKLRFNIQLAVLVSEISNTKIIPFLLKVISNRFFVTHNQYILTGNLRRCFYGHIYISIWNGRLVLSDLCKCVAVEWKKYARDKTFNIILCHNSPYDKLWLIMVYQWACEDTLLPITWWTVVQSCAKSCVPSIIQNENIIIVSKTKWKQNNTLSTAR